MTRIIATGTDGHVVFDGTSVTVSRSPVGGQSVSGHSFPLCAVSAVHYVRGVRHAERAHSTGGKFGFSLTGTARDASTGLRRAHTPPTAHVRFGKEHAAEFAALHRVLEEALARLPRTAYC